MTKEQPTPEDANNPTLADRLGMIERLEEELMRKGTALMKKNTALSHADMFILGATRRVLAQAKGFRMLIIERNFPCAAAILRMQLDTAMRMNGLLLVEDLDVFCDELLQGKRFNAHRDSDGNRLTDAYLRKKLAEKYPWIISIYEGGSDFVHLSARHFYGTIVSMDEGERRMILQISGTDPMRPEDVYFEIVDEFFQVSKVVMTMLLGYFLARAESFHP